ncbi:MAG: phospholipase D-like domain-containing protein [Promethearchaeota archaeon]
MYISPFDCRARDFIAKLLSAAESFAYICIETFTDPNFPDELKKISLKGIDIRIISGSESMDFQDRMNEKFKELIATNVKMKTIIGYVHGKMIVTDKHLLISSVNFNKMNLGFYKSKKFWRANTETILVCSDKELIEKAKQDYLQTYEKGIKIEKKLAEKIESKVGSIFTTIFGLKTKKEVKVLFSRLIISKDIEVKKFILTIGKITFKIMQHFKRNMVQKEDFLLSLILFYLSERKHDIDQIQKKLEILETDFNLDELLDILIENEFVEKEGDHYKINIRKLF